MQLFVVWRPGTAAMDRVCSAGGSIEPGSGAAGLLERLELLRLQASGNGGAAGAGASAGRRRRSQGVGEQLREFLKAVVTVAQLGAEAG